MKKKILGAIALMLVTVMALGSCSVIDGIKDFIGDLGQSILPPVDLNDAPLAGDMLIDFKEGANADVLTESDGWSNGDVFNVVWKKQNVFYENGIMRLGIVNEKANAWLNDAEVEFNYTAGEARTQNYYHYGDFEVCMKPSANPGTASTFFTCTGPYDIKYVLDENGDYLLDESGKRVSVENPHDEIDIEFLGDDTTKVQFNFFVDGKGGNEYMHELGFDASEGFHTYGYRWEPDSITWFVDGEPVYKVTTDTSVTPAGNLKVVEKLPSTPGRILTNYWCGTERAWAWMGVYKGEINDNGTEYKWMKTSAEGAPLNPEEKPEATETIDWTKVQAVEPTFQSTEIYTVTNDGTTSNVTYSEVGGASYLNVEMDITAVAAGNNYVHLKVTNNGNTLSKVRVNVNNSSNTAINLSATQDGTDVFTDLVYGGSFFEIAAGATAELVVKYSGTAAKLQLMLDSATYGDTNTYSGDLTFDDIKFAKSGAVETPDNGGNDSGNDGGNDSGNNGGNDSGNNGGNDSGDNTAWDGKLSYHTDNTYVITPADQPTESVNVTYVDMKDKSYWNVNAWIKDAASGKTNISLKIKNNGTELVKITVKIEAAGAVALMEGKMEIPAGEEHTFSQAFTGEAEMLYFFIDSGWVPDEDVREHSGDVTISGVSFDGEATPPTGGDNEGNDPVTPPAGDDTDPVDTSKLVFVTGTYTITPNNVATDTLSVSYENMKGGTYNNICSVISKFGNNFNTFTVTIKNNGAAAVRVRVDIKGTKKVGNTDICNLSATGNGQTLFTDLQWGGSFIDLAAGEEATVVVTYATNHGDGKDFGSVSELLIYFDTSTYQDANSYSGNLTLSGFGFSTVN